MIATIRQAKSRLSELVASAERGEEVIITSHGKPRVRLVPVPQPKKAGLDIERLRRIAKQVSTGRRDVQDSTQIISELREDR
jgi:prevent-host-death family protein